MNSRNIIKHDTASKCWRKLRIVYPETALAEHQEKLYVFTFLVSVPDILEEELCYEQNN